MGNIVLPFLLEKVEGKLPEGNEVLQRLSEHFSGEKPLTTKEREMYTNPSWPVFWTKEEGEAYWAKIREERAKMPVAESNSVNIAALREALSKKGLE
jgi:hypothetical protein